MYDLFLSELKRYRLYAILAAVSLFGYLMFFDGIRPIMANDVEQVMGYIAFVLVLALGFSIAQMFLHKRKSHWAFLMHRPLSISQIFNAVVGSGAMLVTLVSVIPVLCILIINDLNGVDIVEGRHYAFVLHVGFVALFCYFLGVYTVLNPSWGAILAIGLLYFVMVSDPMSSTTNIFIDVVCTLLVFLLAKWSFKVNVSLHFSRKREIFVATAVSHILIIALLYLSQVVFYHLPLYVIGEHPDTYKKEALNGYYAQLWHIDNEELVDLVVDETLYPNKATLKQQMALAPKYYLRSNFQALPAKGQIFHQDKSYALDDAPNITRWLFSHREMLFVGKHKRTGEIVGYFGPTQFFESDVNLASVSASDRFKSVPAVDSNNIVRTLNTLYTVDFSEKYIDVKHQLNEGEFYLRDMQTSAGLPALAYVTNKALYIFNKANFDEENTYTEPDHSVPHPKLIRALRTIEIYELVDGFVIAYPSSHYFGFEQPGISLNHLSLDGQVTYLGEKSFVKYRPLPDLISHQDVVMSPLGFALGFKSIEMLTKSEISPDYVTFNERLKFDYPSSVYITAFTIWFVCALLTYVLGRKQKHEVKTLLFWQGMVLLFSLGGFVSFLLMHRWQELIKSPKTIKPKAVSTISNAPISSIS